MEDLKKDWRMKEDGGRKPKSRKKPEIKGRGVVAAEIRIKTSLRKDRWKSRFGQRFEKKHGKRDASTEVHLPSLREIVEQNQSAEQSGGGSGIQR